MNSRRITTLGLVSVFCWGLIAGIWLTRWAVESGHSPHICMPTKDKSP